MAHEESSMTLEESRRRGFEADPKPEVPPLRLESREDVARRFRHSFDSESMVRYEVHHHPYDDPRFSQEFRDPRDFGMFSERGWGSGYREELPYGAPSSHQSLGDLREYPGYARDYPGPPRGRYTPPRE